MKQKEIWLAQLDPTKGREQKGTRPVVIISGNTMNTNSPTCIICPLTSTIRNLPGCIVLRSTSANGLKNTSEVLTPQIRMVSQERLMKKWGTITDEQLSAIKKGLFEILYY